MTLLPGYFSAGPFIALVLFIKYPLDPRRCNGGGGGALCTFLQGCVIIKY